MDTYFRGEIVLLERERQIVYKQDGVYKEDKHIVKLVKRGRVQTTWEIEGGYTKGTKTFQQILDRNNNIMGSYHNFFLFFWVPDTIFFYFNSWQLSKDGQKIQPGRESNPRSSNSETEALPPSQLGWLSPLSKFILGSRTIYGYEKLT